VKKAALCSLFGIIKVFAGFQLSACNAEFSEDYYCISEIPDSF
jgi:hypothetical protein